MQFGLFGGARTKRGAGFEDSQGYETFIDYVTEADRLGFKQLFMVEHHFTGHGQVSASMTVLAYLAGRTRNIRLGTAVVVLPWHNPVLIAEQAATLDLLSGGRFDFGVGKGYRQAEFDGFVIPITEATERFDEAEAAITAMREDRTVSGSLRLLAGAAWYAAELAQRTGRVADAENEARLALDLTPDDVNLFTGAAG